MKMDIACPAELLHFEQADFGEGRRQAYLTFLNESPYPIVALSGVLALLDTQGELLEERRISFGALEAPAGTRFTCHLALDGYPGFDAAEMVIEDVVFAGEEPAWALHPLRLKEYAPPVLPEGPERNALISIAGEDAVCFPQQHENMWVCVCGRYNRWRWTACRRCRRERDAVLSTLQPDRVMDMYEQRVEMNRKKPPKVIVDGSQRREKEEKPKPPRARRVLPEDLRGRIITAVMCLLVVALLVWGIVALMQRMPAQTRQTGPDTAPPIISDYLEPIT